ncbi:MAG: hypothetical protein IKL25_04950, partial [Clostridia bacterium]|nr:hypothetical protein [Clostridia bacterium]
RGNPCGISRSVDSCMIKWPVLMRGSFFSGKFRILLELFAKNLPHQKILDEANGQAMLVPTRYLLSIPSFFSQYPAEKCFTLLQNPGKSGTMIGGEMVC